MIFVDFRGNFPWFWLIFCYLDPDPFHWSGSGWPKWNGSKRILIHNTAKNNMFCHLYAINKSVKSFKKIWFLWFLVDLLCKFFWFLLNFCYPDPGGRNKTDPIRSGSATLILREADENKGKGDWNFREEKQNLKNGGGEEYQIVGNSIHPYLWPRRTRSCRRCRWRSCWSAGPSRCHWRAGRAGPAFRSSSNTRTLNLDVKGKASR